MTRERRTVQREACQAPSTTWARLSWAIAGLTIAAALLAAHVIPLLH